MQLSVPSPWEFYLPLIHAGIDLGAAELAWRYRSPLRELSYSRLRTIGDVAGWADLCISGDGTVYPSILMLDDKTQSCGSVRSASLSEIWEHAAPLLALRALDIMELHAPCASCHLAEICGGGSRSRGLACHGHIWAGDDACPIVAQARAVEAVN